MKHEFPTANKKVVVFGDVDAKAVNQMRTCIANKHAIQATIMADGHVGYDLPIGGVIAYRNAINPMGVGFDIGCGNKAVKLEPDVNGKEIIKDIQKIMDRVSEEIPSGVGSNTNGKFEDDTIFDYATWDEIEEIKKLKDRARQQLGSIGSGNHFVDIFTDEEDNVWIGVHFGSRGFGYNVAKGFHALSAGKQFTEGHRGPSKVLSLETELGQKYLEAMKLAGAYARRGRDIVCENVAKIIGTNIIESVHNHHNFAWKETHEGIGDVVVVRKGATPLWPGQVSFIGSTMTEDSLIVQGKDENRVSKQDTLMSTVHGAGRELSRSKAKKTISKKDMETDVAMAGVELRGSGIDESPQAYKRLDKVIEHHLDTLRILHKLSPIGVAMS